MTRWIFLRALALIYAIAFSSLAVQIKGLIGIEGIAPAVDFLEYAQKFGAWRFWFIPTLAWFNSSDQVLIGLSSLGVIFSALLFLNIAPRLALGVLWFLYLSLVSVGGVFMNFQWDALLLETGFLAIFYAPSGLLPQRRGAPSPNRGVHFLLKWLFFRLMLQSALVKWLSGDLLWRKFTALTVHYQTQPLPNPLSWYAHHLPAGFQKFSCVTMFVIEGLMIFLIFAPRRARFAGFWFLAGFQFLILLTGNYTYFNLLAIALCFLLLDDEMLRKVYPASWNEPFKEGVSRRWMGSVGVLMVLYLTSIPFFSMARIQLPSWMSAPLRGISSFRSFNNYGLFAVMTPSRPEIILEGTYDGKTWLPYEFKYKPGALARMPAQVAPYQPRLDWQMWFAALGDYRQNPWLMNFCARLLQGSKPAAELLAYNPFPGKPPLAVRTLLYEYRFTTPVERKQTGNWWARELKGAYSPPLALKPS